MRSLIYAVGILLLLNSCATTEIPPRPGPHHQRLDKVELKGEEAPVFIRQRSMPPKQGVWKTLN